MLQRLIEWKGGTRGGCAVAGRFWVAMAIGAVLAGGCSRHHQAAEAPAATSVRRTPSGLPVPRYVSLKFDKVNARGGPGDDYRLLWTYRARGLPLQVVAETDEWRRVCDPDGELAWVHRRTVNETRRTVMRTASDPVLIRAQPSEAASAKATLLGHAIADLKECQGDWCRVSADHASGWVRAVDVWGLVDAPQCHAG